MLDRLKKLFTSETDIRVLAQDDLELAAAALLVETAMMDGTFDDDERTVVLNLLEERFNLTGDDAHALLANAKDTIDKANEIYTLTRTVKDNFEHPQRVELIEMLWRVAYADSELHDYEANIIRRLAGLLYVTDRESGEARQRVLDDLT